MRKAHFGGIGGWLAAGVLAAALALSAAPFAAAQDEEVPEVVEALPAGEEMPPPPGQEMPVAPVEEAPPAVEEMPAPPPPAVADELPPAAPADPASRLRPMPEMPQPRVGAPAPRSMSRPGAMPPSRASSRFSNLRPPAAVAPGEAPTTGPAAERAATPNEEKTGEAAAEPVNFDFRDAALAEVIADAARLGLDPGAYDVLERYQRWRRFDTATMGVALWDGPWSGFDTSAQLVKILDAQPAR